VEKRTAKIKVMIFDTHLKKEKTGTLSIAALVAIPAFSFSFRVSLLLIPALDRLLQKTGSISPLCSVIKLRDSCTGLPSVWLYMILPPLPADAARLCEELAAPPLLVRHLTLVHAAAAELLDGLAAMFPGLDLDRDAILFGSATHDLAKTLHQHELTGPGHQHESDGPALLEQHGVPRRIARLARTHGRWRDVDDLETLIVALADSIWCGRRVEELESKFTTTLAATLGEEPWQVWAKLDAVCEEIAEKGEERLAWQATT
jgi:hypothetical protein